MAVAIRRFLLAAPSRRMGISIFVEVQLSGLKQGLKGSGIVRSITDIISMM